ncbi:MAG: PKD domain-containing protein, partial [Bacteroidota bacterium]
MSIPIPTPDKFAGRSAVRSGPIVRSQPVSGDNPPDPNPPLYGVIYTQSNPSSLQDFNVNTLIGAKIENKELDQTGDDPFFTILGGYYCERLTKNGEKIVNISQIFGIAAEPAKGFNLQPGNHSLVDEWEREDLYQDKRKQFMDERAYGKNGWTFIVTYKPNRHLYPLGCTPMGLTQNCPVISSVQVTEDKLTDVEQRVTAQVNVFGAPPIEGYTWEWGDGNTSETTEPTARHTYQRSKDVPANYAVKVTIHAADGCTDTQTHHFPSAPQPCPQIRFTKITVTRLNGLQSRVDVDVEVITGTPTDFKWVWKDGSEHEITPNSNNSHIYQHSFEGPKVYDIKVVARGPGDCVDRIHCETTVGGADCPVIKGIKKVSETLTETTLEVTYEAVMKDPHVLPKEFIWNWGDGTIDTVTDLRISHSYTRPSGDAITRNITLNGNMPGTCPDKPQHTEKVIPGVCPVIGDLTLKTIRTTDTEQVVLATLEVDPNGPQPTDFNWDFDDGATDNTKVPQVEHTYARPAGDNKTVTVSVQTVGPGSTCDQNRSAQTDLAGACPVIHGITTEVLSQEGDQAKVRMTALVFGPPPTSFKWNVGDGSEGVTTKDPTLVHTYILPYDGQLDATITVNTDGPDSCHASAKTKLSLDGPACPLSQGLSYEFVRGTKEGEVTIRFEIAVGSPAPSSFVWDFGDGSAPQTTDTPVVSHVYEQPFGTDKIVTISVTSNGPSTCSERLTTTVVIPHVCPVMGEITSSKVAVADASKEKFTFNWQVLSPVVPESFEWDFGDGSPLETTKEPTATHEYARSLGVDQLYTVKVRAIGPGECGQSIQTSVKIIHHCPWVKEVRKVEKAVKGKDRKVDFEVILTEGQADKYIWSFGDGSPTVTTTEPTVSHTYESLAGQDANFPVHVKLEGPGVCQPEGQTSVLVPGHDACPTLSRIDVVLAEEDDKSATFAFAPVFAKGRPTSFTWDFGDGSAPETTTDPTIYHAFPQGAKGKQFEVKLTTSGPGDCKASGSVYVDGPEGEE